VAVESPDTINTTEIEDGQAAGSITPIRIRTIVESLAGVFSSTTASSFTFTFAHRGTIIETTSASAVNATIPPNSSVSFDVGTVLGLCQVGTGQAAFVAGAGVTFRVPGSLLARAQWSEIYARQRAVNEWVISGDTT